MTLEHDGAGAGDMGAIEEEEEEEHDF